MQCSDLVDRARTDECIRDGGEGDWQWRESETRGVEEQLARHSTHTHALV